MNALTPNQKIEICKRTRIHAKDSLLAVLKRILTSDLEPSEAEIRDMWLNELRKNPAIFNDGWYCPPPHGIGVLVGNESDGTLNRVTYKSLRHPDTWPRTDVFLNRENGLIYAYASPIDKETGIIGDFGVSLYFGKNQAIIDHLRQCDQIINEVFEFVEPGKTFDEIAKYMKSLIDARGLNNEIECITSPSPADDVGHTIPFVMEEMTQAESELLTNPVAPKINKMISEKRLFVRAGESQIVQKGMAFTIEPRPKVTKNPDIPMVSFHTICAIYENGEKELITNFNELFEFVGMDYMK